MQCQYYIRLAFGYFHSTCLGQSDEKSRWTHRTNPPKAHSGTSTTQELSNSPFHLVPGFRASSMDVWYTYNKLEGKNSRSCLLSLSLTTKITEQSKSWQSDQEDRKLRVSTESMWRFMALFIAFPSDIAATQLIISHTMTPSQQPSSIADGDMKLDLLTSNLTHATSTPTLARLMPLLKTVKLVRLCWFGLTAFTMKTLGDVSDMLSPATLTVLWCTGVLLTRGGRTKLQQSLGKIWPDWCEASITYKNVTSQVVKARELASIPLQIVLNEVPKEDLPPHVSNSPTPGKIFSTSRWPCSLMSSDTAAVITPMSSSNCENLYIITTTWFTLSFGGWTVPFYA